MKTLVSFKLDAELVERLRKMSDETYIPQVKIVALALEKYIKEESKNNDK